MSSVKQEMRNSFLWNAIENFSRIGIQFIIGVILARLLNTSDYGIIGIISVFIAISQTLIDAGFANALIQRKYCSRDDYSTVFLVNITIAIVIFCLLYVSAPLIAEFYDSPILANTLRVMGLSIVLQSLYTVHKVKLTKELKFKHLAYVAFFSSIVSGVVAIALAYYGFGVWSLVIQTLFSIMLQGIFILILARWRPNILFSKESFNNLSKFGSKLLVSNLLYTVFNNIYNLVIGKCFQPAVLGYYTRADGYAKLVPNNISGILQNIMLPVLSKLQDDDEKLKDLYTKFIKLSSLFIYPLSLLFCALSKPMILLMLTEKWSNTIPILQVLCIASLFDHLISINNNYLIVKGKSDYVLRLSATSKVFLIIVLLASFKFGIIAVAWSKFLYYIVTYCISAYYIKKTFYIGITHVIQSTTIIFIISTIVAMYAWGVSSYLTISWLNLMIVLITSIILYVILSKLFMNDMLNLIKSIKK